jgi:hypothetical protein
MKHPRMPRLVTTAALLLATLFAGSARADMLGLPLVGIYVVVGMRAASDVATTDTARENDSARTYLGTELRFGDRVSWYRDRCEARLGPEDNSDIIERNLSDLQIVPGPSDRRLNRHLIIDCLGRPIGDIWRVLVVDDRVLVARSASYSTYLILEKPLAPGDIAALKRKLKQAGFDPGELDETLGGPARAALADYAMKHGAKLRLMPGIITSNVMDALARVSSP